MSEYEELQGMILTAMDSVIENGKAVNRYADAVNEQVGKVWADVAELRDELHALANRVETLTRARLTEPAEVAEAVVKRMHEVRLRPRGYGDGAVAVCNCGWRSEEMATGTAALARGYGHVQEVTANA